MYHRGSGLEQATGHRDGDGDENGHALRPEPRGTSPSRGESNRWNSKRRLTTPSRSIWNLRMQKPAPSRRLFLRLQSPVVVQAGPG
jgi:hypothetical protein